MDPKESFPMVKWLLKNADKKNPREANPPSAREAGSVGPEVRVLGRSLSHMW